MYKRITERLIRTTFAQISAGDHEGATRAVAEDAHHVFPGANALGGERHSRDAMLRWLARLERLIPEVEFEVQRVSVKGPPWDMWVAVQWTDRGKAADGEPYENRGAHWMRIRRGRAISIQAYLDTEPVTALCNRLAAAGFTEAAAAPVTD